MFVLFATNSSHSHLFGGQYNTNLTPCSRVTQESSISGPLIDKKALSLAFIKTNHIATAADNMKLPLLFSSRV
jgi:hypothetical protein